MDNYQSFNQSAVPNFNDLMKYINNVNSQNSNVQNLFNQFNTIPQNNNFPNLNLQDLQKDQIYQTQSQNELYNLFTNMMKSKFILKIDNSTLLTSNNNSFLN